MATMAYSAVYGILVYFRLTALPHDGNLTVIMYADVLLFFLVHTVLHTVSSQPQTQL